MQRRTINVRIPPDGGSMAKAKKARAVGFNHVALEVGDIEAALTFYGRLFDFELRGKGATSAFIDLGDQFIALQKGRTQAADNGRHFGLVVDDKEAVRKALADAGVEILPGPLDRKSTRLNSSHLGISYAVFCLKKKKNNKNK